MPKQDGTNNGGETSEDESIPPFVKTYIDQEIKNAQKADDSSRKKRWKNAWRSASPLTRGTFILTGAVAFATIAYSLIAAFQLHEMRRTNDLTQQALQNADKNSLNASNQFLVQLQHFDAGLGVNGLQLGKLDASIAQASRLATDTEVANKNVLEADRPWVGAAISMTSFAANEKTAFTIVFTNSGRRPAIIQQTVVRYSALAKFPADPEKFLAEITDGIDSQSFMVPGQSSLAPNVSDTALSQSTMDAINSGKLTFFVFAEAKYVDVRSKEPHHTQFCVYYIPRAKTSTDNGFRNCPYYHDSN